MEVFSGFIKTKVSQLKHILPFPSKHIAACTYQIMLNYQHLRANIILFQDKFVNIAIINAQKNLFF